MKTDPQKETFAEQPVQSETPIPSPAIAAKKPLSSWSVMRNRNYALMFWGQLISAAGTQMQIVAVAWQVYLLTHSPVALGLIGLVQLPENVNPAKALAVAVPRVDCHRAGRRIRMRPELREILTNVLEVKSITERDSAETIPTWDSVRHQALLRARSASSRPARGVPPRRRLVRHRHPAWAPAPPSRPRAACRCRRR